MFKLSPLQMEQNNYYFVQGAYSCFNIYNHNFIIASVPLSSDEVSPNVEIDKKNVSGSSFDPLHPPSHPIAIGEIYNLNLNLAAEVDFISYKKYLLAKTKTYNINISNDSNCSISKNIDIKENEIH